jgi:hypothetical protein
MIHFNNKVLFMENFTIFITYYSINVTLHFIPVHVIHLLVLLSTNFIDRNCVRTYV